MQETHHAAPDEPRSWKPARERPAVKSDPILVDDPTPAELAKAFNQLHRCVEAKAKGHNRRFAKLEASNKRLEAGQDEIREGLGLGDKPKKHRTVATQTRRGAFLRTVMATFIGFGGALAAIGGALRLSVAIWPSLKALAAAVLHAFLTGKL